MYTRPSDRNRPFFIRLSQCEKALTSSVTGKIRPVSCRLDLHLRFLTVTLAESSQIDIHGFRRYFGTDHVLPVFL